MQASPTSDGYHWGLLGALAFLAYLDLWRCPRWQLHCFRQPASGREWATLKPATHIQYQIAACQTVRRLGMTVRRRFLSI